MTTERRPDTGGGQVWRRLLVWVLIAVGVAFVGGVVLDVVSTIDFAEVGRALARLTPFDIAVLVVVGLGRQILAGAPMAYLVPGLSVNRAVRSDLAAAVVGTFAPPPSDLVLRHAMFRSWSVDPAIGFAGYALNTLLFYATRFGMPLLGLLGYALIAAQLPRPAVALGLVSTLAAAAIATVIIVVARADRAARAVGRLAGRAARRFGRDEVVPEDWARRLVEYRGRVATQLRRRWPAATGAMVGGVLVEAVLLVMTARFVGVSDDDVPALALAAALLAVYPLTALPFFGLGFVEAAAITIVAQSFGDQVVNGLVTAFLVWRLVTLVLPLLLGGATLLLWRREHGPVDAAGRV